MSSEKGICPICGEEARINSSSAFGEELRCKHCGDLVEFDDFTSKILEKNTTEGWQFRAGLYYYFTHMKKTERKPYYIYDSLYIKEVPDGRDEKCHVVTKQEIMNLYPKNYSEMIDKILLNLAALSQGVGGKINLEISNEYVKRVFFSEDGDPQKIEQFRDLLVETGYIQWLSGHSLEEYPSYVLKSKAWLRIDELQKYNKVFKQGFIAMCFDDDMESVEKSIKSALFDIGYEPYIAKDDQHNDEIMIEIYYKIQTSDFLIADLTHNRGGVYLEAGYALGLGKEVIFTVDERRLFDEDGKENKSEKPHFDVQQRNQIRYKDEEDLRQKLKKRITAVMGLKEQ